MKKEFEIEARNLLLRHRVNNLGTETMNAFPETKITAEEIGPTRLKITLKGSERAARHFEQGLSAIGF